MARQITRRAEASRLHRLSPTTRLFTGGLLYPLVTVAAYAHGVGDGDKGYTREISVSNTLQSDSSCIASARLAGHTKAA